MYNWFYLAWDSGNFCVNSAISKASVTKRLVMSSTKGVFRQRTSMVLLRMMFTMLQKLLSGHVNRVSIAKKPWLAWELDVEFVCKPVNKWQSVVTLWKLAVGQPLFPMPVSAWNVRISLVKLICVLLVLSFYIADYFRALLTVLREDAIVNLKRLSLQISFISWVT